MRIATFNVNGVNGRPPVLRRWLEEAEPDIVCLQELKAPDKRFPASAMEGGAAAGDSRARTAAQLDLAAPSASSY
jgi:exonuclease III